MQELSERSVSYFLDLKLEYHNQVVFEEIVYFVFSTNDADLVILGT